MAQRRRRPACVGHLARCAVLRFRDSRPAGQVFLRLAGRADRLPVQLPDPVQQDRRGFRSASARRHQHRAASFPRQGHRQFPWPVLAGSAARHRPPRADPPARQRLPDRRWREDEQVARHLRDGAYVPRCRPGAGGTALLLRRQVRWWRRRPRPEPGRLHRARQRRSGRQVRQPRQPLRRFHQQALRWPVGRAAARRGAVPALRRWPGADP
ncbi:hypothetical protein STIN111742_20780 [Stenotrophomonas indicatrix]